MLADIARLNSAFEPLGGVSGERLSWSPHQDAWSAAQVLEHLCVAADSYLEGIERRVRDPAARRVEDLDRQAWRPSLAGGLLTRSFEGERRLRAPRIYRPGVAPRPGVVSAFLERQARLVRLLEAARELDWRRTRFVSPVSALVRMNLGDAFLVLVRHAQRHLRQIERVLPSAP